MAEATSRDENGQPKYPAIGTLRSLFSTGAPQLYANLDRERCKDMGISISDVFTAMNATFGALYVNDFNYLGRTFQVRMQAEADYRLLPESLHDIFVRTNKACRCPGCHHDPGTPHGAPDHGTLQRVPRRPPHG